MATRWRIDLEYDGAGFAGWQVQPGQRTVQGVVEQAVEVLCGEHARVCPSGRTDAGVHAEQQVASFVVAAERSARAMRDGLNASLPSDVAVLAAAPVPMSFDPRRDVRHKCYRYTWLLRPARSPLLAGRAWHLRTQLDEERMRDAAQHLVGTHDFESFRASGCQADHAVRTVEAIELARGGELLEMRVRGHGFLRHMVRIIAGTLTEVGRGRRPAGWVAEVRDARQRTQAGRTAPAHGLCLERVGYGELD